MNVKNNHKYQNIFLTTTDTVVGLGCFDEKELPLLFELKQRPRHKKIIILVGSIDQARQFRQWNLKADLAAQKYWPGATTLIVNNQGFRMPNQAGLLKFLLKNGPAYVTSANISSQQPLSLESAQKIFSVIDNVYDFGKGSNKPSTIVNLDTDEIIERN
ncbi:L-threonylcarbamoyladenylate synthase [Candidatus Mycoplasma pogonae]